MDVSCYVDQPDVSAACQTYPDLSGDAQVPTASGRYPPAYYALVGPVSLVATDYSGIWLMRCSAPASAPCLVTAGLLVLRRHPEGGTTLPVLLLALTPMAFFLFGVVNPSALEVAAAFAVWVVAVVLARGQGGVDRTTVAVLTVAGAHGLHPAVVPRLARGDRARRGHPRRASPPRCAAAVPTRPGREVILAAACTVQVAWTLLSGVIAVPDPRRAVDSPFSVVARLAIGDSADQLHQLIGNFGWLDIPAPAITVVLWLVLLGTALLAAALVARCRELAVLGSLVVAMVALPIAADIQQAAATGLVWQGRQHLAAGDGRAARGGLRPGP